MWLFALAALIGFQLGAGFVSATTIFEYVETGAYSSTIAGTVAGDLFAIINKVTVAVSIALLIALFLLIPYRQQPWLLRSLLGMLIAVIALWAVEAIVIAPEIVSLREQLAMEFGSVSETPADDLRRKRFGFLHGMSAIRAIVQLTLELIAFFAFALGRKTARD